MKYKIDATLYIGNIRREKLKYQIFNAKTELSESKIDIDLDKEINIITDIADIPIIVSILQNNNIVFDIKIYGWLI